MIILIMFVLLKFFYCFENIDLIITDMYIQYDDFYTIKTPYDLK